MAEMTRGVDRENKTIRGHACAQVGVFKSSGRGQFNMASLQKIVKLWPAAGLKCRLTHPNPIVDGLVNFLGRDINPRIVGQKILADLVLDDSSFRTPSGDLGTYIMDRAESDPESFSCSLVLFSVRIKELDDRGHPVLDADGDELPPLWYPKKLWACDIVDTGDACDGFLSRNVPIEIREKELELLARREPASGASPQLSIRERELRLLALKRN